MKTSFTVCMLGAAACLPALAADDAPVPKPDPFKGQIHEVSITLEDCKRLVGYVPDADVAYQPGVDVRGKPVVPAEGPDADALGQIKLPDEIVIDFGYDFAGAYGIPNTGLETATAGILTIIYDLGQGGLTVNGKSLKSADARAVKKACEMMLKSGGVQK